MIPFNTDTIETKSSLLAPFLTRKIYNYILFLMTTYVRTYVHCENLIIQNNEFQVRSIIIFFLKIMFQKSDFIQ